MYKKVIQAKKSQSERENLTHIQGEELKLIPALTCSLKLTAYDSLA